MSAHSATARQCMELATAAAPAMVTRAIDLAITALQDEEQRSQAVSQRRELADAWLELSKSRQQWAQRHPVLPRAAQSAKETPAAPKTAGALSADRFGGLSLVD